MHWFKRNIGDYHKKAGRLTMLQHGAYTLLMDACYDREKFPTLDDAIDWTWASSDDEIDAIKFVLKKFFTLEGDVYIQHRIKEEVADYQSKAQKNKQIALDREEKRRNASSTSRAKVVDEPPPNQEPRTKNQEPLTNNKPKDFRPMSIKPTYAKKEEWQEYISFRNKVKAASTERGYNMAIKEFDISISKGISFNEILDLISEKSWKSYKHEWFENTNNSFSSQKTKTIGGSEWSIS